MLKFKDFEQLYNKGQKRYVQLFNKKPKQSGPITPLSFEEITSLANQDPMMEIGWLLPKGFLVLDIDDTTTADIILKIIKDREEKVMVEKTTRGIHIWCKSSFDKKTVNNILAIGAMADTIPSGNVPICTAFKNPRVNQDPNLQFREIVYYNGIEEIPFWLTPIFKFGKKPEDNFITFPLTEEIEDNTFISIRKSRMYKTYK